ncbi:hypothetical protein HNP84_004116 [Thermocatellispora tengchongensis]|uniref:Lantibiotic dehydratase n=1 Tax=Thermocatellispora tengchongensis TaxID=1073253 RepID=A0A840NZN1_9ACTN|nr:lantibiotic dehydratase [Thermocatellispora tengchongensis]MBB5134384.1 hypothetical protein [Thermocatellispora tengchongensis]
MSREETWTLLPTLVVRSAGFPWETVLALAHPRAGEIAGEIARLERQARDLLADRPPGGHLPRGPLSRLRNLRPLPPRTPGPPGWIAAWNKITTRLEEVRAALPAAVEADSAAAGAALAAVTADERFLDALVTSAPAVYRDVCRGVQGRRMRRQLAAYVQRLCAKCETMSFFGPIDYGRVDPRAPSGYTWAGHRACAARVAYPAARVGEALQERILADPAVVAGLVPRRKTWTRPMRDAAGVLERCDGRRTVAEIAAAAGIEVSRACAVVVAGVRRGLLTHGLCPPATVPDPLGWLRERLPAHGGPVPEAAEIAGLLERYPQAPPAEKPAIQERVAELAGEARRPAGPGERGGPRFYNDRVIVHEAARGTLRVTAGGGLAADLAGRVPRVLDLLAEDAELTRWRTNRLLAARLGRGAFRLADALRAGAGLEIRHGDRLARRVAEILRGSPPGAVSVDLAAHAREPVPPAAPVLCSADVMVAAPALEAYEPGRTPLVLGDIHDAALLTPWALQFHPDAAALTAARDDAIERALTGFTALNVIARRGGGLPPLEFPGPVLELGGVAADPRRRRIGLDTLFVHSDGERAELRAHGLAGPLLFHNGELDTAVHTALALPRIRRPALPDLPYIPRLTWDNVVVSRRRWLIGRDRFDALGAAPGDSGRLVAMARLRAEHDLPGAFFASSPAERKPIYVDSRAPALLDGLVRLARTADRLTLTETLPGPEECWLRDGGLRFAAELRCVYLRPAAGAQGEERRWTC